MRTNEKLTLRQLRLKLAMTQKQFGAKIFTSQSNVASYESNSRTIPVGVAIRIMERFNVDAILSLETKSFLFCVSTK